MNLHPKLRRELQTKFSGARSETEIRARAAQKKVEREKVKMALSSMQTDWTEWISEALLKTCRKDLAKSVIPQVKKMDQDLEKVTTRRKQRSLTWGR